MIRFVLTATAAAAITFGVVSSLNASAPPRDEFNPKITVNERNNVHCVYVRHAEGSRLGIDECHSVEEWKEMGISFSNAPAK